ncbi:MAG: hypothetical protein C0592_02810 [Marinilabiliales bacterium]|nr:MAG: hypothetical protein C0592_02810 [Marinilabiliales bacterium]
MNTLNVVLNGNIVQANEGESILELATRNEIHIPTLCHDPRLEPFSSCFVCVVEVEKMRGLQPACSTKVTEGMVVNTDTDEVRASRKMALDLLVSNHYADCIGPCKDTCPAGVDVQGYISLIEKGMYSEAIGLIKEANPLPAICGRVCVRPCEAACRRNLLDEGTGVGIDYLKRYAADRDLESGNHFSPELAPATGKKVAVIGGGPGGLSAAYWLAEKGHEVEIFEGMPHAGGWLRYGIPEYRLPNELIEKEISTITELGVKLTTEKKLGENLSYKEIKENFDATILAIGSQRGTLVGVEGEDADGVYSGIDFLRNMEVTGQKYDFKGKTVVVVGGGNTAMDCCRTSQRCGADKVIVVYRRTEAEMPANPIEIHESKLEGIEYMLLTNPVAINKDGEGKLKSIVCVKMELGEPDASGRRRPVPIEGSEFELEVDILLAAIGQKTDVNFIDDINANTDSGELKINRWGDIDAKSDTLETGIPGVFAAGDGVTGPATAIEAIAQAKVAVHSCDQYLHGEEIKPLPKEFFSKRDNFKKQDPADYSNKFKKQMREEMPVLDADQRMNFDEVELGYANAEVAAHETGRCLECGCQALYTCDLKEYATEYGAVQNKFGGTFNEYEVDFSHPYLEFDPAKCILCGRCVRICDEVVGAGALGFINRGFDTFVAPAMGGSLVDTDCESCGQCLSTCPTGAIAENKFFKPGPVETDTFNTICNYCSVGCEIEVHHRNGFVMGIKGAKGYINKGGNLCAHGRFGYQYMIDNQRIDKPVLKENGKWKEIEWTEAIDLIKSKIQGVNADENAFMAGARLTNEEMYLIQKFARAGAKTNNVASFHYMERGKGYSLNAIDNVPFEEIKDASDIYLLSAHISKTNGVAGFFVQNARKTKEIPVTLIKACDCNDTDHKADRIIEIKSHYAMFKAMNYYLLANGKQNNMFINGRTKGYEDYYQAIQKEDYDKLITESGLSKDQIESLANEMNNAMNSVIMYSEEDISSAAALEILNFNLITGKQGKMASGTIALKTKNNSQGLRDMGICPKTSVGGRSLMEAREDLQKLWGVNDLSDRVDYSIKDKLMNYEVKNLFIFGEDPVGTALDEKEVNDLIFNTGFVVVADSFLSETAKAANLVLPLAFGFETGGSFTNTQRVIQRFEAKCEPINEVNNIDMMNMFNEAFGLKTYETADEVFDEISGLLPAEAENIFDFSITDGDNPRNMFDNGADYLMDRFRKEFVSSFEN